MGNFYVNYTLRGPSQQAVADALAGRLAIVTPAMNDFVVVFDQMSDSQEQDAIVELGKRLSRELQCVVLAVLNHDDDILWYKLWHRGEVIDNYDSTPGYFDVSAELSTPIGGDAHKLCAAFGATNVTEVERILRSGSSDDEGYIFAIERHADLARALEMPQFGVGGSYGSISAGELSEGLDKNELIKVV